MVLFVEVKIIMSFGSDDNIGQNLYSYFEEVSICPDQPWLIQGASQGNNFVIIIIIILFIIIFA